jgi:hypothetical protein
VQIDQYLSVKIEPKLSIVLYDINGPVGIWIKIHLNLKARSLAFYCFSDLATELLLNKVCH